MEQYKEKIIQIIKHNSIFFIGVALLVYKGIFLNYVLQLEIKADVFFYSFVASMLMMSPIIHHKNKFALVYLNIVYAIITLILYADFLYYHYSTNFLSLYQIENLKYAKEIGSGVLTIIHIKNIVLLWVDNLLLLIFSIFLYRNSKPTVYPNKKLKFICIIIIVCINISIVKKQINNIYTEKMYNKSLIVQNASIYYYHYEDAKDYIINLLGKDEVDEEKLKNIYEEKQKEKVEKTPYTGIAKESNVIILQLESLNEYIIGKKVNGKEIMPNLNQFLKENISATDMYNQGLGTTADSEFEMENSMYPLENGYVFQKYYNNTWFDIYTTLRDNGYYTSFMHPNTSTFWNREEVYKKGYHIDEYHDINQFPNIEYAGEFYSDEGFLREAVKKMNLYQGKFCTTLVSVTTHIPFYLTGISNLEEKLTITEEDLIGYEDETFRNYLLSCNFVDYAFGKFMEDLKETGLMEKSILVVYGDHGAGNGNLHDLKKLYESNEMVYTEFENATKEVHIPFGIKIPQIEKPEVIQRTLSKIDIKPTILDLLGVEDKFSLGKSIFSNKDESFIKGLGYITSQNYYLHGKYYDKETLEEIEETEELQKTLQRMEDEIYLSDAIIKHNLLDQ